MNAECRVLVVDDDLSVTKSLDRVLTTKGYSVVTVGSGEEALIKIQNEHYDAVYTDIRMSGMSGLEVAEQVKARQPRLPVIVITGYGTEAYEKRASAAGVKQFLNKPLTPEMIENSIEQVLHIEPSSATIEVKEFAEPILAPIEEPDRSKIKDILLFLAAPFIGLLYAILLPFVGIGMGLWFFGQALLKNKAAKHIALAIAAPFVGLVYIIVLPFAGLAMLAYFGGKELLTITKT